MGLRDDARDELKRRERRRCEDFREQAGANFFGIVKVLNARPKDPRPPINDGLALDREWLFGGLLVDVELQHGLHDDSDPPIRMYYRIEDDDLRVHLVGGCRHCDALTPLEPAVDPQDPYVTFAEAEHLRAPVSGHVCPHARAQDLP